jgi:hypothetical protein
MINIQNKWSNQWAFNDQTVQVICEKLYLLLDIPARVKYYIMILRTKNSLCHWVLQYNLVVFIIQIGLCFILYKIILSVPIIQKCNKIWHNILITTITLKWILQVYHYRFLYIKNNIRNMYISIFHIDWYISRL